MTNETNNKWRFCVVGNIIGEHIGEDGNVYFGTKAFKKGTKVYINEKFYAEGQNDVWVIDGDRRICGQCYIRVMDKLCENMEQESKLHIEEEINNDIMMILASMK